jgi:hypothetical protein
MLQLWRDRSATTYHLDATTTPMGGTMYGIALAPEIFRSRPACVLQRTDRDDVLDHHSFTAKPSADR